MTVGKPNSFITLLLLGAVAVALVGCGADAASVKPNAAAASPLQNYNTAEGLRNSGHCDRAVSLYLKAIQQNSLYVSAYLGLGNCYQTQGNANEAVVEYNKVIPIDPRNWFLYYTRAQAEVSLGMNGQGQVDYNTALSLAPHVRATYVSIANGFSSFSEFEDGLKAMDKAVALSPNDPSLYEARGNMYLAAQQYTNAYNDYIKAISVAPYKGLQASINAALATVYANQSDFDSAFSYMRVAISLSPRDPQLYVQSGDIHRNAGPDHYQDAISLYQKALGLVGHGTNAEAAHEGIGDVLAAEGQTAAAIAAYRQAARLSVDPTGVKAKIKALQQPGQP